MLERLLIVVAVVVLTGLLGRWYRRRAGRLRGVTVTGGLTSAQLRAVGLGSGSADGTQALVLGSSSCPPCATLRSLLDDVAAARPAFRWRYVDAADHLALAEAHAVRRVPTLFVLDGEGRILARTSGVPVRADLERAVDRAGDLRPVA